jgi:hypothetical protein
MLQLTLQKQADDFMKEEITMLTTMPIRSGGFQMRSKESRLSLEPRIA